MAGIAIWLLAEVPGLSVFQVVIKGIDEQSLLSPEIVQLYVEIIEALLISPAQ